MACGHTEECCLFYPTDPEELLNKLFQLLQLEPLLKIRFVLSVALHLQSKSANRVTLSSSNVLGLFTAFIHTHR